MRIAIVLAAVFLVLRVDAALVFRRVCSYCRDKEVYRQGRNYVGFYQKHNTGPLEGYPCRNDPGNLMKCSTSCIQAQFIERDTGNVFTYRDCGTYLLQEFGKEKFNLSYTQYAMILTDIDDVGNTWIFKFCNKEKCLHPSDYELDDTASADQIAGNSNPTGLYIIAFSVLIGVVAGLAIASEFLYNRK
ncbi:hypothetical protein Q1695_001357 [Nippostrongylus brasiliensis]|nr:hypothetical protein Q1695_001357 [Nippostrongylus brasiliensis]